MSTAHDLSFDSAAGASHFHRPLSVLILDLALGYNHPCRSRPSGSLKDLKRSTRRRGKDANRTAQSHKSLKAMSASAQCDPPLIRDH